MTNIVIQEETYEDDPMRWHNWSQTKGSVTVLNGQGDVTMVLGGMGSLALDLEREAFMRGVHIGGVAMAMFAYCEILYPSMQSETDAAYGIVCFLIWAMQGRV